MKIIKIFRLRLQKILIILKILIIFKILIVYNDKDNNYKNVNKDNINEVFYKIFIINK